MYMKMQNKLLKKKNKAAEEQKVSAKLSVKYETVHNIGARESQQDNYALSDYQDYLLTNTKGHLAVVADGMGGLANGSEMSGIVVSSLLEYFVNEPFRKSIPAELLTMVYRANKEVLEYVRQIRGELSGSTVVVTDIIDNNLYFASVGDSRIYLIRGGMPIQLNREDVYRNELYQRVGAGELSYEGAESDPERKSLTSFMGVDPLEHVDYNMEPIALCEGDRVVLMTDGVFGTLTDAEICQAIWKTESSAAETLEFMVLAKEKSGQDNFTAVILTIE